MILPFIISVSREVLMAVPIVTKNLERIGDHATKIAEDVIYMVVGRDVRHLAADRR